MNPVQTHHSDYGGGWIFAHSLLCGSIPTPSSWPRTRSEYLTLRNREEQFYDNSSRRCLTQSARLHLLRISSWPLNRSNILPSKQKENTKRMLPINAKIFRPSAIETKVLVAIVGRVSVSGINNLRYGAHIMGSVKLWLLFMWGFRPLTEHETSFRNVK